MFLTPWKQMAFLWFVIHGCKKVNAKLVPKPKLLENLVTIDIKNSILTKFIKVINK
jgi:hypothetical protein